MTNKIFIVILLWSLAIAAWVWANPPPGTPGETTGLMNASGSYIGIGIAPALPSAPLHVAGNTDCADGGKTCGLSLVKIEHLSTTDTTEKTASIDFIGHNTLNIPKFMGKIMSFPENGNITTAGLSFYTRSGNTAPTEVERMRILGNGNIIIGATNPDDKRNYKLEVVNAGNFNQSIYSRATDGGVTRFGLENITRHWSISNYGTALAPSGSSEEKGSFFIADETANKVRLSIDVNGLINVNGNKIINVGTPTNAADAATKAYVDSQTGGSNPEKIWGEGRPGIGVVNTAGECTVNNIKVSRSTIALGWGSAAAACPAGWWVCNATERGSNVCGSGNRSSSPCNPAAGQSSAYAWVSDNGGPDSMGDQTRYNGKKIDTAGDIKPEPVCSLLPVWCCLL